MDCKLQSRTTTARHSSSRHLQRLAKQADDSGTEIPPVIETTKAYTIYGLIRGVRTCAGNYPSPSSEYHGIRWIAAKRTYNIHTKLAARRR